MSANDFIHYEWPWWQTLKSNETLTLNPGTGRKWNWTDYGQLKDVWTSQHVYDMREIEMKPLPSVDPWPNGMQLIEWDT